MSALKRAVPLITRNYSVKLRRTMAKWDFATLTSCLSPILHASIPKDVHTQPPPPILPIMLSAKQKKSWRKETGVFYYHLPIPLQEQLVIFCEGELETTETEYTVTVTYKDDSIELGKISNSKRCLLWKCSEDTVPDSMTSEKESGMAKLLVEKADAAVQIDDMQSTSFSHKAELKNINENTPQITDETENTPERPQKKRKNSLNKDEKTPTGQIKKQKTQKVPTRLRTGKEDNEQKSKNSSPKTENSDQTANKITKSRKKSVSETEGDKKDLPVKVDKRFKRKDSAEAKNTKKEVEASEDDSVRELGKAKAGKSAGAKQGKLTERLNAEQNLTDNKSEDSDMDTKQGFKTVKRKSGIKKKTDSPDNTKVETKRTRKTMKDKQNESVADDESNSCSENTNADTNKENVQVDSNIPKSETDKSGDILKSPKKDVEQTKALTVSTTGTPATCKDLTLRALDRPSGRWGHSLCFVNRNMSVLIGGQGEKQQISKDSVWTLDCETRRWKDPDTQAEGQKPEYRMGHTASYDPLVRCVYVFGGSKNTRWFRDVHILDIEEWKWQLVKVNGKAPTRAYHSATLYRHELWIFGGVYPRPDPQPDGCSNEVHIFSPVMESWYSPIVSGEKPIPRSGHSATLINDQLVVFGGWDAPISYNDLHVLDMSIVEWSQPKVTGTPPSPRSWHASCALSGNRLLIHGGYNGDFALEDTHIFNLDNMSWIQLHVENKPTARVGHKALCMPYRHDNEEEDEVIIFGGGDNDGAYFDDLYNIFVPFHPATVS